MAQTINGGKAAAETNKRLYGEDFYARIGARGGSVCKPKGFALNIALAREAGRKAGRISKRGHRFIENKGGYSYYLAINTGRVVKYKNEDHSKEQDSTYRQG